MERPDTALVESGTYPFVYNSQQPHDVRTSPKHKMVHTRHQRTCWHEGESHSPDQKVWTPNLVLWCGSQTIDPSTWKYSVNMKAEAFVFVEKLCDDFVKKCLIVPLQGR